MLVPSVIGMNDSVVVDCDTCLVRSAAACGDCVVTVLLGAPPDGVVLDDSEITALDVIRAVDAPTVMDRCPLDLVEHKDRLCPLHAKLARTYAMIETALRESTLRDLVETDPRVADRLPSACRADSRIRR